jgi:hypothetical protein
MKVYLLRINQAVLYDRSTIGFSADAILGDRQLLLQRFLDERHIGI